MSSKISWTDETWNPVAGCTKCSPGCLNCYAEKMAARLKWIGNDNPQYLGKTDAEGNWTGKIECCDWLLGKPLHWKTPRRIFVCSMSDLFHEKVPFEFIARVFLIAQRCPWHTFLLLTKRIEKALEFYKWDYPLGLAKEWGQLGNIHLGVSISTQAEADEKIPILLQTPAAVRFVSVEPMLEYIDWDLATLNVCPDCGGSGEEYKGEPTVACGTCGGDGAIRDKLDGIIIGAESRGGHPGRPCKLEWVRDLVKQCDTAGVPVHIKQLHINGKLVKDVNKFPADLQRREFLK